MGLAENLRIDCYAALLKKYQPLFPHARFEIIMREPFSFLKVQPHILSPSHTLLHTYKDQHFSFDEFAEKIEEEFFNSPEAVNKLKELRQIAEQQILFLVCGEKDSKLCHRSLVRKYILELDYFLDKWFLPFL